MGVLEPTYQNIQLKKKEKAQKTLQITFDKDNVKKIQNDSNFHQVSSRVMNTKNIVKQKEKYQKGWKNIY